MRSLHRVRNLVNKVSEIPDGFAATQEGLRAVRDEIKSLTGPQLDEIKILAAKHLINQIKQHGVYDDIHDAEFKAFSQFGDDGIIQYLINNIEIEDQTFIEFGVSNYAESNTRFLLMNNNWTGLVMDGSKVNIDFIKSEDIYWRYDLTAVQAFIDRENINDLIAGNGFGGRVGILSIDLDGNDYWIWESISVVDPVIVISEYNSVFGDRHALTIPYDPGFQRTRAHYSNLFWGCSLKALCLLAAKKGYVFVGSNANGNNAYFVRSDKLGRIRPQTVATGYVKSKFRESRSPNGELSYLAGEERLRAISDMTIYDVEQGQLVKIRDLKIAG